MRNPYVGHHLVKDKVKNMNTESGLPKCIEERKQDECPSIGKMEERKFFLIDVKLHKGGGARV